MFGRDCVTTHTGIFYLQEQSEGKKGKTVDLTPRSSRSSYTTTRWMGSVWADAVTDTVTVLLLKDCDLEGIVPVPKEFENKVLISFI